MGDDFQDDDGFDVIVLGAGPAGENAAGRCADGGLAVAIVERELVGGECSYWGCIPSKTLLRPGDVLAAARRVPGAAEAVTGHLDVGAAFARRDDMTSAYQDDGQVPWLEDKGIELIRGTGRLAGDRTVVVESADGGQRSLRARRGVVLATGSRAAIPPIDGLGAIAPWDNRAATSAKELPRRLLVLGGGAIGAEMAQAFKRLGTDEVTVVEAMDRLLAREEPFAGDEVKAAFEDEGITVMTATKLVAARRQGNGGPVLATLDDGREVAADEILVAVGRRPNTADVGLDTVGLEPGRSVDVDDLGRAKAVAGGWLFAVGDCNGRALLTHMGKYQARLVADVLLGRSPTALGGDVVPRVTFTDPQVCAVGVTVAEATEQGIDIDVVSYPTSGVAGAATQGTGATGTSQLVIDRSRSVVVGATFTGAGVQELLHSATIAIVGEVPLERLWHAVPSFPTLSEVWLRLLEDCGL